MNIGNAFVSDTLTFANNANINSDIPFYIDTGSDRYIKFIDTRDSGKVSLIFGYDKETDSYEINASTGSIFNIKNLNNLSVDTINAAQVNMVTSSTFSSLESSLTNLVVTGSIIVSGSLEETIGKPMLDVLGDISAAGNITASGNITAIGNISASQYVYADRYYIEDKQLARLSSGNDILTLNSSTLHTVLQGSTVLIPNHITASGNISGSSTSTGSFGAVQIGGVNS